MPRQPCASCDDEEPADPGAVIPAPVAVPPRPDPVRVLAYAANGVGDEIALVMLARLLEDLPIALEISQTRMLASDVTALINEKKFSIVCIADLPPSASSKTRYLVKRLRAAFPDLRIVVGRWAPPALADENTQVLRDAGATHVASTLVETKKYLATLVDVLPARGVDAA